MLFSDEVFFLEDGMWWMKSTFYNKTLKSTVFVCRSWLCFRKNGKGGACGLSWWPEQNWRRAAQLMASSILESGKSWMLISQHVKVASKSQGKSELLPFLSEDFTVGMELI